MILIREHISTIPLYNKDTIKGDIVGYFSPTHPTNKFIYTSFGWYVMVLKKDGTWSVGFLEDYKTHGLRHSYTILLKEENKKVLLIHRANQLINYLNDDVVGVIKKLGCQ